MAKVNMVLKAYQFLLYTDIMKKVERQGKVGNRAVALLAILSILPSQETCRERTE